MIIDPASATGQALLRSHNAARQVYAFDASGSALYGGKPLPITGGELTLTWTDAVRARATVYLPAMPDLVPTGPGSMLGIGLGYFDVYMGTPSHTVQVARMYPVSCLRRRPEHVLEFRLADQASRVAERLVNGAITGTSATVKGWIEGLLRAATGSATLTVTDNTTGTRGNQGMGSTTVTYPFGDAMSRHLTELADGIKAWCHVTANGGWVLEDDPGAPGTSVVTLKAGAGGTVVNVEDGFDRANIGANRYLVKADGSAYGNPDEYGSAVLTTGDYTPALIGGIDRYEQTENYGSGWANPQAQSFLARVSPNLRRWRIEAVPHPGIEPGDTITLDETATGGVTTDLMVDTVQLPFDLDQTMTLVCRNAVGTVT